jgi:hypothetical protein
MPKSNRTKLPALFLLTIVLLAVYGCASRPSLTPEASAPDGPLTVAQVEQLAGFDVMEPTYLPAGVTFDSATIQGAPSAAVTLHFKLVHETYGDMGQFFLITQQPKDGAPSNPAACGAAGDECETIQAGDTEVQYRFTEPTESLMWESGGYAFVLTRTAGEPGKVYKEELLKVVEGMR